MALTKLVTRLSPLQFQEHLYGSTVVSFLHTCASLCGSRQGGMYKMDYIIKRERPIGPHKKLAPGVRYDGRIGPVENYRYRVNYPEVGAAYNQCQS